ncbi:phage tail assembly protein T [Escherichia coli]|nr:phage tail assembly protein T [Escherichia coli]
MQFVMRLAREFRRPDWRRMLSEMSATELGEWGDYFMTQSFSDVWVDAQFSTLKSLMVQMVSGERLPPGEFSLVPDEGEAEISERTGDELMHLGEGISGGMRFEPDSGSCY